MARCVSASVVVGSEANVRGGSHLVCQRRFGIEENRQGMVILPRENEYPWLELFIGPSSACEAPAA